MSNQNLTAKDLRQQGWPVPESVPDEAIVGVRAYRTDVEQDTDVMGGEQYEYCQFESNFRAYFSWNRRPVQ